jgi:hypothetical protein
VPGIKFSLGDIISARHLSWRGTKIYSVISNKYSGFDVSAKEQSQTPLHPVWLCYGGMKKIFDVKNFLRR